MEDFKPTIIRERRRSIALQIKPDSTVVVKAPYLIPMFIINRFIKEKEEWILAKLKQVKTFKQAKKISFQEGDIFQFLGKEYKLRIIHSEGIELTDSLYFPFKNKRSIKTKLQKWYKENALTIFIKRVEEYAQIMDVTYKDIGLSNAKRKWGSCSHRDELAFNWRLIMAPMPVIDYVVIHELAHTLQKNHSPKFWNIVKKYCPDFKEKRNWLKVNGNAMEITFT